jgi:geranylgeranyl pyrophosphate synthase
LVDDVLDYTSDAATLGKANMSDLKEGYATGPVLFEYFNLN